MKKNPLNTSLRSATQATDSTRSGCNANSPATPAHSQSRAAGLIPPAALRVARRSTRNNNTAFAAWSSRLVR